MPLILLGLLSAGTVGLFVGSQVDDAVEKKFEPIGGGTGPGFKIPFILQAGLVVAVGTAAFVLVKKNLK